MFSYVSRPVAVHPVIPTNSTHVTSGDSPSWLLEFILFNQAVCKEPPKISFVVLPCEGMPALPNM